MALTYDQISGITTKFYMKRVVDNIFNSNPLLYRWRKNSDIYQTVDGGTSFMVPLAYAANTSGGAYNGSTDTLQLQDNDQMTAAEFTPRFYYASMVISRKDELANAGDEQMVSFVSSKVQLAEKTLMDNLGTGLFNTGSSSGTLDGLRALVNTTSPTTYGGISGTDNSWWRATKDTTTTITSIAKLQGGFGDVTIDSDKPTLAVTTQNLFDKFFSILQPQQRYSDSKTANAGFDNVLYRSVPVLVDSHVPASHWFFLNEKYIKWLVYKNENFRFRKFEQIQNQNVAAAYIFWGGNLATSNRRMHQLFTGLSES